MQNLKNIFFYIYSALFLVFVSCSSEQNHMEFDSTDLFYKIYPTAKIQSNVSHGDYQIIKFKDKKIKSEAWFNKNGWAVTVTEIPVKQISRDLKYKISNSEFDDWTVLEIHKLTRRNYEDLLVTTVEKNKVIYDLYYDVNGVLLRKSDETGVALTNQRFVPAEIPAKVKADFLEKYPDGRIFDVEGFVEAVEILAFDDNKSKSLIYDSNGSWLYSAWELRPEEVNPAIMRELKNQYSGCDIDVVIYTKTSSSEIYIVECLVNGVKQSFYISPKGKILF